MAWSPYKDAVIRYVSRHPGCSKWDVASYCTRSCQRCASKQYYIVNTALRNGWIAGRRIGRAYRLYVPTEQSKQTARVRAERRRSKAAPSLSERLAAYKYRRRLERLQEAEDRRREEEYRREVEATMPQGRIRFNAEGGFSAKQMGAPEAVEILFEDKTDSPFALHLTPESFDLLPAGPPAERQWVVSAWDLKKGKPHKALERRCYWRRVPKIPWLKRWEKGE